jgi:hypothetical protein
LKPRNPSRRDFLTGAGGWIPHRHDMLVSPSWRHRPRPLVRLLERLEVEHLRHGGAENGSLRVSWAQFVECGISKRVIRATVEAGDRLGLLAVWQPNEMVGNLRAPAEYRLTYVPAKRQAAPTDEWRSVNEAQVQAAIMAFHNATRQKRKVSYPSPGSLVPFPVAKKRRL